MGNKCFKNEEKNILTNFEDEDQYETLKENLIEDLFEGDNIFLEKYKDEYKIINIIQKDFIYNIYKAQNINEKREVCLKVYNKNKLELGDYDFFLEKIKREEEIVKICNSKNIVNIYKKIETPYNIIFEMESWDINLSDYIEKNGEFPYNETFREILYGITDALKILHKNNIIHRNIRP
jgi:serine/threonine protein kinase